MKKFAKELSVSQSIVYEYLKKVTTNDAENFIDNLMELNDSFECIPERVYNSYKSLNAIELVEVIHFFSKYLLRRKEG